MNVAEIVALITQLGPLGFELFTKLEARMNLGPDEKQNIANGLAAANAADQDTINRVGAWMAAHGFQAQVTFVPVVPAP